MKNILHVKMLIIFSTILIFVYKVTGTNDPCITPSIITGVINNTQRSPNHMLKAGSTPLCDRRIKEGWYKVISYTGDRMTTTCTTSGCNTHYPIWLNGTIPLHDEGVVNRKACIAHTHFGCCLSTVDIKIRNCNETILYYLKQTPGCDMAYCFGSKDNTTSTKPTPLSTQYTSSSQTAYLTTTIKPATTKLTTSTTRITTTQRTTSKTLSTTSQITHSQPAPITNTTTTKTPDPTTTSTFTTRKTKTSSSTPQPSTHTTPTTTIPLIITTKSTSASTVTTQPATTQRIISMRSSTKAPLPTTTITTNPSIPSSTRQIQSKPIHLTTTKISTILKTTAETIKTDGEIVSDGSKQNTMVSMSSSDAVISVSVIASVVVVLAISVSVVCVYRYKFKNTKQVVETYDNLSNESMTAPFTSLEMRSEATTGQTGHYKSKKLLNHENNEYEKLQKNIELEPYSSLKLQGGAHYNSIFMEHINVTESDGAYGGEPIYMQIPDKK